MLIHTIGTFKDLSAHTPTYQNTSMGLHAYAEYLCTNVRKCTPRTSPRVTGKIPKPQNAHAQERQLHPQTPVHGAHSGGAGTRTPQRTPLLVEEGSQQPHVSQTGTASPFFDDTQSSRIDCAQHNVHGSPHNGQGTENDTQTGTQQLLDSPRTEVVPETQLSTGGGPASPQQHTQDGSQDIDLGGGDDYGQRNEEQDIVGGGSAPKPPASPESPPQRRHDNGMGGRGYDGWHGGGGYGGGGYVPSLPSQGERTDKDTPVRSSGHADGDAGREGMGAVGGSGADTRPLGSGEVVGSPSDPFGFGLVSPAGQAQPGRAPEWHHAHRDAGMHSLTQEGTEGEMDMGEVEDEFLQSLQHGGWDVFDFMSPTPREDPHGRGYEPILWCRSPEHGSDSDDRATDGLSDGRDESDQEGAREGDMGTEKTLEQEREEEISVGREEREGGKEGESEETGGMKDASQMEGDGGDGGGGGHDGGGGGMIDGGGYDGDDDGMDVDHDGDDVGAEEEKEGEGEEGKGKGKEKEKEAAATLTPGSKLKAQNMTGRAGHVAAYTTPPKPRRDEAVCPVVDEDEVEDEEPDQSRLIMSQPVKGKEGEAERPQRGAAAAMRPKAYPVSVTELGDREKAELWPQLKRLKYVVAAVCFGQCAVMAAV